MRGQHYERNDALQTAVRQGLRAAGSCVEKLQY